MCRKIRKQSKKSVARSQGNWQSNVTISGRIQTNVGRPALRTIGDCGVTLRARCMAPLDGVRKPSSAPRRAVVRRDRRKLSRLTPSRRAYSIFACSTNTQCGTSGIAASIHHLIARIACCALRTFALHAARVSVPRAELLQKDAPPNQRVATSAPQVPIGQ